MNDSSKEDELVCAVDLGGTNLRAANIDRNGCIHERVRNSTPQSDKPEDVVARVAAAVRDCEAQALKRGARVQSVSVVVPGTVHIETGLVVNAPNLRSVQGYKLGPALESALHRPVLLENDANASALGERWQGAARGHQTIICLTLGTGVGGGIILDGKLWRGPDGTAGELGHTSVEPFGGAQCKCGNTGCLEVYASATAIVRITRESLAQHPNSLLHSINATELTSERICNAAIAGDELALDVFQRAGVYLGIAMANFVNIFNPEMIVIGGGVSAAWDLFAQHARAEVIKRAFPVPAQRCQIVRAECGDDAGLIGAAWLAIDREQ
ncbi:MAG TPA: ROK family protein [Pyrinomonadaceae bacterium]